MRLTTHLSRHRWTLKKIRINRTYSKSIVGYMSTVESAYANDDGSFVQLYSVLRTPVERAARYWHSRIGWTGVSQSDLLSQFWMKTWQLCETYCPGHSEYLLYETIRRALPNVARDMYRQQMTRQRQFERSIEPLDSDMVTPTHFIDSLLLQQFISCLPGKQRELATLYCTDPTVSDRCAATLLQCHHSTIRRLREQLKRRLHSWYQR